MAFPGSPPRLAEQVPVTIPLALQCRSASAERSWRVHPRINKELDVVLKHAGCGLLRLLPQPLPPRRDRDRWPGVQVAR
ncbi:MAG: hypothetical protein H6Q05_4285 [Acidobacteria bacterium]|nr:hypothetical protein [Acidobacteriota bacterium]